MKKKLLMTSFVLVCLLFTACIVELSSEITGGKHPPYGVPPHNGEVTGSAWGWQSNVSVALTLADGVITNVVLDISGESPIYVRRVPAVVIPRIIARNALDTVTVDVVANATRTTNAIRAAGRQALEGIPGVEFVDW